MELKAQAFNVTAAGDGIVDFHIRVENLFLGLFWKESPPFIDVLEDALVVPDVLGREHRGVPHHALTIVLHKHMWIDGVCAWRWKGYLHSYLGEWMKLLGYHTSMICD